MPWKLGTPDDPTVEIEIRLPLSMKQFLQKQPGGISRYIRKLVAARMRAQKRRKAGDDDLVV